VRTSVWIDSPCPIHDKYITSHMVCTILYKQNICFFIYRMYIIPYITCKMLYIFPCILHVNCIYWPTYVYCLIYCIYIAANLYILTCVYIFYIAYYKIYRCFVYLLLFTCLFFWGKNIYHFSTFQMYSKIINSLKITTACCIYWYFVFSFRLVSGWLLEVTMTSHQPAMESDVVSRWMSGMFSAHECSSMSIRMPQAPHSDLVRTLEDVTNILQLFKCIIFFTITYTNARWDVCQKIVFESHNINIGKEIKYLHNKFPNYRALQ
jgi:hypothetical protein